MPSDLTAPVRVTVPTDETPAPFAFRVSGEAFDRIQITASGVYVGTGLAAPTLATDAGDGSLTVAGTATFNGQVVIAEAKNIALGTTTGTKFGTATTQKLGFYNVTPVVQPAGTVDVLASLVTLGLRAASSNPPLNLGTGAITAGNIDSSTVIGIGTAVRTATAGLNLVSGSTAASGIAFGTDTNLYRSSGTQLKTDGDFVVGGRLYPLEHIAMADGAAKGNIVLGTSTGTRIGTATTQLLGFYNATPIAQRSGAAQTAVVTTASTQTTPFGYATQAQADAIVTLANELRAWAVAQGFIKGSA